MPRHSTLEKLAEPIDIGSVRLKNRMMKNGTRFFWDDPATGGFMNDKYIDYYEEVAKGGLALASTALQPMQTVGRAGGSSATSTSTAGAAGPTRSTATTAWPSSSCSTSVE